MKKKFRPIKQVLPNECVRCAVASIFGLDRESVPNFIESGNWFKSLQQWLNSKGWEADVKEADEYSKGDLYMGNWITEKAAHAVVMQDEAIKHNPSGATVATLHNITTFHELKEVEL